MRKLFALTMIMALSITLLLCSLETSKAYHLAKKETQIEQSISYGI